MRYRPFGAISGMALSVVTLQLEDRSRMNARAWRELLEGAMATGVNSFILAGDSPALLDGLRDAMALVERRLLFLAWKAPAAGELHGPVRTMIQRLGCDQFDLLILSNPLQLDDARALKIERYTRHLALDAEDPDMGLGENGVDCLITPYNLLSGWRDRRRLKDASARDMAVIAHDVCPQALTDPPKSLLNPKGWFKLGKKKVVERDNYGFLTQTHGWTAEGICLAFALTEPAVTTVRFTVESLEQIEALAEVPSRDLPTGVSAQIEMARFGAISA